MAACEPTDDEDGRPPLLMTDGETQDMTQPPEMSQRQEPAQSSEENGSSSAEEATWGRLICLAPVPGLYELRQKQVVVGRTTNSTAQVQIEDARISSSHCRIFWTKKGQAHQVQLLDMSSNGTYVNAKLVGKEKLHTLVNGDEIALLNPNPSSHVGGGAAGCKPTHYHYLYQDLRPAPRPAPQPSPPKQMPRTKLLQNTSFMDGHARPSLSDYETVRELGRGSFATVKKVVHCATGGQFAMKVMEKKKLLGARVRGLPPEELMSQTLSEARILKSLSHPNIIQFHDVFETDTELCLLVELVEGGELFDHLLEHGAFCEADARAVMKQLLDAVGYLHSQNIVHRDLKPENILLQKREGESVPTCKIADFGLAKLVGSDKVTSTFCGTPQYFAPEVLGCRESKRGYDSACDLWSLGVILFILLSGSPPFDEARPMSENTPTPSIFDQIRVGIRASFHFAYEPWPSVSLAAKNLVQMLLHVDPQRRATVTDAQGHTWMVDKDAPDAVLHVHRLSAPLEDISEYSDEEEARHRSGRAARPARRSNPPLGQPASRVGGRRPFSAPPESSKRRRTTQAAPMPLQTKAAPMPLQTKAAPNGRVMPPPASQPQFKQPHPPSRNAAASGAGVKGGKGNASSSRIGALNIMRS